jgi:hypothetical protein
MSELFRALGALVEPPHAGLAPIAEALELGPLPTASEHTEAIVFSLYPYASVYLGAEGMIGGEARDRVAGFFRALGAPISSEPDHVTVLLASYAALAEREELAHARKALFWEHLASFLPAYASAMQTLGIEFYTRWATLLSEALRAEATRLGPPDRLPLHLLETTPLAVSEATSLSELLGGILAPARSGMILVRRDVLRAARHLGLAARAGERRWALSAMLSQDAPGVLAWLAAEARAWAARHRLHDDPVSVVWAARAERTSEVLMAQANLAREADHVLAL